MVPAWIVMDALKHQLRGSRVDHRSSKAIAAPALQQPRQGLRVGPVIRLVEHGSSVADNGPGRDGDFQTCRPTFEGSAAPVRLSLQSSGAGSLIGDV
jgi:hypothetical protein